MWQNRPDIAGWASMHDASTAPYNAVEAGNLESVKFLLGNGADPSMKSVRTQRLPVERARNLKNDAMVTLIESKTTKSAPIFTFWKVFGWS